MESGKEPEQITRLLDLLHELGVTVTFEKVEWSEGRFVFMEKYRSLVM
jgi:EAL domain-containing protein (putative c-di-GMP-specific phosphodiesterase class I)